MDIEAQYDKLYRYCYFRVGSRTQAEDITQEAFLKLLAARNGRLKNETAYLYRIAHNLCVDALRKSRRETLLPPDEMEPFLPQHAWEETSAQRTDIVTALQSFSPEERELLLLKYVNEEKDAVLCELFGISRFALYRKLKRLREALRKKLNDYDSASYGEGLS